MSNNPKPINPSPRAIESAARIAARRNRDALVIVVLLFLVAAVTYILAPVRLLEGSAPDLPHADRRPQSIDPNTAAWYELAQLPGLGEALAKRITSYRSEQQSRHGARTPVFQAPADLTKVRGIGEKTVQRIAIFLRFDGAPPAD